MAIYEKPDPQGTYADRSRLSGTAAGAPRPLNHEHDSAQTPAGPDPDDPSGAAHRPSSADPAELALLERAQEGDHEAFRDLMESHERLVYRLVLRMLGCDPHTAADVTQEVFLRAFRSIRAFDGRALFRTWLHKITMNLCITEHRKRKALKRDRTTLSLDGASGGGPGDTGDAARVGMDPVASEPGPMERVHHQDIGAAVAAAVQKLPEEFRQCVLLRDMNGMSYEEIAEILDLVPGTVRSRIHRGRMILQRLLKEFSP